jgi:cobalamin biosynthesis protein CobT
MRKNEFSRYWLDDALDSMPGESATGGKDAIKLNAYRNAISNFVRIVTGDSNIKVRFKGNNSYTDGKTVTIGTNLNDKDFDPAVGLALHEGAHIKLTDFDTLKSLDDFIQKHDEFLIQFTEKHGLADRWSSSAHISPKLKDIFNIVEDRRIDNYVYKAAPGYQGYYQSLYDKYFNAKIIDKGLQSSEYRTCDWDSYMFRLINITNLNRDLKALPSLEEIWKVLDLKNIDRLKSSSDALELAWEIFCMIEDNIPAAVKTDEPGNDPSTKSDESGEGSGMSGDGAESDNDDIESDGDSGSEDEEENEGDSEIGTDMESISYDELSEAQKTRLHKAIDQQRDFMKGIIKKSKASRTLENMLKAMESSGITREDLDVNGIFGKIPVIVIRQFNMGLVKSVDSDMWWQDENYSKRYIDRNLEFINRGIQLGTVLGKKLKVRAEERNTKFNRQYNGKLDKRMISACGYGLESIFERVESFTYSPGSIHISIDNSGSMSGSKFEKSLVTASAIAKACSMIESMDCIISFRSSGHFSGHSGRSNVAQMVIAYDSRMHSLSHLRTMLPYIKCAGSTPEGLCFDAYMKEIVKDARGKDAFFLNFSDGEPCHEGYGGEKAYSHTRMQVNKMKANNIKVVSYFITSGNHYYSSSMDAFRSMYGRDAQNINVENMNDVARTLNQKFLEVSDK